MGRTIMTLEVFMSRGLRRDILESILSREDASTFQEIAMDVAPMGYSNGGIISNLDKLVAREVVVREPDHRHARRSIYYISPKYDEVQMILRKLFPEKF